jgi:hypothetical protein
MIEARIAAPKNAKKIKVCGHLILTLIGKVEMIAAIM